MHISFRCKTEEIYKKFLEKLYQKTESSLPTETAQGKSNDHYVSWEAKDKSYVFLHIFDNQDNFPVGIQVTMPRPPSPTKKGLK